MRKILSILLSVFMIFSMLNINAYASIYGDADNSGSLTSTDSVLVINKVLNSSYKLPIENTADDYLKFIDIDGDGIISLKDSALIMKKVLNDDYKFPVENENVRIKITIGNESAIVKLENNTAAKNFANMLPLNLSFEDFNNTEKISYLPKDLDTEDTQGGVTPAVGDFTLYKPWGNIAIFYKTFSYSSDLIKLGEFESGLEILTKQSGNFNATIDFADKSETEKTNTLTLYFSATGTTKNVAEKIADILGSDIYEIVPKEPYTVADLNYNNSSSRANNEQNDPNARPEIEGKIPNIDNYDIIYLGYPIWWGNCPKIIYTLLESYDLSGKTIIPFCTSASSGISTSVNNIKKLTNADVKEGKRFDSSVTTAEIENWLKNY